MVGYKQNMQLQKYSDSLQFFFNPVSGIGGHDNEEGQKDSKFRSTSWGNP
jgi:hypothetical protein